MKVIPTIDLTKHAVINFFFGRIIRKLRELKIKRYKAKKVKTEAKNTPERMYNMHFKISLRDKDGFIESDTIFDIQIPASGYFYAKKKLERFVVGNIDVNVVNFESLPSEEKFSQAEEEEKTWQEEVNQNL